MATGPGYRGVVAEAGLRILLVDDEPDVRLLLRIQLRSVEGLSVVGEASNGRQALEACRVERPDVVVMDLLMPVMNGFEAIEALRREMPEVAAVAYTAVAGELARTELSRLGVPVVLKSGSPDLLVEAIRRVADAA